MYKITATTIKSPRDLCFHQTNPFKEDEPQYRNGIMLTLIEPSADTGLLISIAKMGLKQIYRQGFRYKKAGIMLMGIVSETIHQDDLFYVNLNKQKREKLLGILDMSIFSYSLLKSIFSFRNVIVSIR